MQEFESFTGNWIEAIRVNAVSREVRNGRALLVKRRRLWSGLAAGTANLFFRAAKFPAFVWVNPAQWQQWEIECFNLLHATQYCAFAGGPRTACFDILPGNSLAEHFVKHTFRVEMLDAAAEELRRAHNLHSAAFGAAWSHGDANLANFLFATAENRARLIDFEIVHERRLPAEERHAEDLLTFLQDLLGCADEINWLPFVLRFLDVYGRSTPAVNLLRDKLTVPGGVPRLWWWIRTNYVSAEILRLRISALHSALG